MTPVEQAVVGIAIGAPSATLGYLAYRRSRKVDEVTAQATATSESRAGTAQVLDGLKDIIANLRLSDEDSREQAVLSRDEARDLAAQLRVCHRHILRYAQRFGEINGNGDHPPGPSRP